MADVRRREPARDAAALALLLALLVLTGVGSDRIADPAEAQGPGLDLKRIGGFDSPVHVASPPGRPDLLFVVEQPGTIRVVRNGKTLRAPFVDLRSRVLYGGEQGLLSIAFDPRHRRNRRLFLYYVTDGGDIAVDSIRAKRKSATRAKKSSRRRVIAIPHPRFENHNGGQLQIGPDGLLYLATGDGGSAGDPSGNAQSGGSLLGKLLRIKPRATRGYSIPKSNPFRRRGGRDEIYALGLRNPYRFSFDRRNGDLWIGDVGQNAVEEINRAGRSRARGANFGWDLFEGNRVFDGNGTEPSQYVPPVHTYDSSGGNCSVIGGYVARGDAPKALQGRYLYADFCGGQIRSLDAGAKNPAGTDAATGLAVESPSSFGEDSRGRLYVTSLDGGVFRIR